MDYYPIFLDLSRIACLVAGAGSVGQRKIRGLLKAGARSVTVVDPAPPRAEGRTAGLWIHPSLRYEQRAFRPEDTEAMGLVFACTPHRAVNRLIAERCRLQNIWCNVADAPDESDFLTPAVARQGGIALAVSTGGASPALAAALRRDLELWLDKGYADAALLLEALRPRVLALGLGSDENAGIFRALCAETFRPRLMAALKSKDHGACLVLLREVLPSPLHCCLAEMLHELK